MSEKDEREEKGFVFRDRRKVSLEDTEGEGRGAGGAREQEAKAEPRRETAHEKGEREQAKADFDEASRQKNIPLPEVTFSTFIFSLSSSALYHLGEVPDPMTQQVQTDLPTAKHVIDTLGMLEEKTRGNLDEDEERLIKSVLYDLRMRFVQKSKK